MLPNVTDQPRPSLTAALTGAEFARWYWRKDELTDFARTLGIRATGGKDLLTARIAAHLGGRDFTEPAAPRRVGRAQLTHPVSGATVIPVGQRCSQVVRAWFIEQVGPSFRFDAAMREFFAHTDGTATLTDALAHYRATRDGDARPIGPQFEYNRFTRAWHAANPAGTRADLLRAWQEYRDRPVEQRGRI